jgi:hypothetical protein
MTPEVVELLRALSASIAPFPRIALLSPGPSERQLFPGARVLERKDWDLGEKRRDLRFDLIIACHVFHYASEPERWFENVGASCRALLIADLIRRKRSAEGELGQDGDAMRYAVDSHRPTVARHFELNSLGARLLARHVFAGAANEYGPALHVLALIRGQLAGPLIYLQGYRAAASTRDASAAADAVIDEFESQDVPAFVGVAPALLNLEPSRIDRLKRLRSVSPALGSDEPARSRWSLFEEPFWASAKQVCERFQGLKSQLEGQLERKVSTYLAGTRRVGRQSARALAQLGFELCVSDRQERAAGLPMLRSDFTGPSPAYPAGRALEVVGLDLSSEAELRRSGAGGGLHGLFEALRAQRQASQARVQELAGRIAAL